MSAFTMPLKRVIEFRPKDVSRETFLRLDEYPIFDSTAPNKRGPSPMRDDLNGMIFDRYWNREIGMETPSLFILALYRRMNEIMPAMNQLYESTLIEFDPLRTIDIRSLATGAAIQETEHEGNNTTETDATSSARSVSSDTPQTMLSGNGDYASSATDSNSKNGVDATAVESSLDKAESTSTNETSTTGYQGAPADLIAGARALIVNVNMMVLDQIGDCFMQVFTNGDAHYPPGYGFYSYGRL